MAEVTKKDLQSLQGYCNKQIADVQKAITEVKSQISDLNKQFASTQAEIKEVRSLIDKRFQTVADDCNEVSNSMVRTCNNLDERISQLQSRVAKLE
jgi:predicted  nucleic acid-binding Zn-ribbon protein